MTQEPETANDTQEPTCPNCGGTMWRHEIDIGVGIEYGPYGCDCGYSEDSEYNMLDGNAGIQEDGSYIDQYGVIYPKGNPVAKAMSIISDSE